MVLQAFLSAALLLAPASGFAASGFAMSAATAGVLMEEDAGSKADGKIHDLVLVKLAGDQLVGGASRIEVTVTNAVVSLEGRVDNAKQKSRAEALAKKVKGVKSVNNKLIIQPR